MNRLFINKGCLKIKDSPFYFNSIFKINLRTKQKVYLFNVYPKEFICPYGIFNSLK